MQCFVCQMDAEAVGTLRTISVNDAVRGKDKVSQVPVCDHCAKNVLKVQDDQS